MKQKGDLEYAYNAQISVDGKSQVIVGQHVRAGRFPGNGSLDEVEERADGRRS